MKPIDLTELALQLRGKRFCELVSYHLSRQNQTRRIKTIKATVALLPDAVRGLAEGFVDQWKTRAYDREFWQFARSINEQQNL